MSVTLTYHTTSEIPAPLLQQLCSEADSLQHTWWAEGINFLADPDGLGRAYGDTRLFLRTVDPGDDSAMAWRDAAFIATQLEKWSSAHSLTWVVSCGGAEAGVISNGNRDSGIASLLESFLEIAEISEPITRERLSRIDEQNADRWRHARDEPRADSFKALASRWSDELTKTAGSLLLGGGEPASPFGHVDGRADFRGLEISLMLKANISNLDLSFARFSGAAQLNVGAVINCKFDYAELDTNIRQVFRQCSFRKARLKEANLGRVFERCVFTEANLNGAAGSEVVFTSCDFTRADLRLASFTHSRFENCCFEGARFHNGYLGRSIFIGGAPTTEQLGNTLL